jgi:hypothetical protein
VGLTVFHAASYDGVIKLRKVIDSNQLAAEVATKVVSDTQFWIVIIGLVGAIIGVLLTVLGNVILHKLKKILKNNSIKTESRCLKVCWMMTVFPINGGIYQYLLPLSVQTKMKPKIYFSKLVLEALKRQMENGG